VRQDFSNLLNGKVQINLAVFFNPTKYSVPLPLEKIGGDLKVTRQGIEIYKNKILNGEEIKPIIVVKHPSKESYAVLDGHHRYYAYRELGKREIKCAIAGDYSSVIFYLTEHGYFQPSIEITDNIRQPAIQLYHSFKQFLINYTNK
jgi:ParB/Sulfiredoxin domain